jgi:hypothetical protein
MTHPPADKHGGSRWRVAATHTVPMTEQQRADAVTALANLITRWQTSQPAQPPPGQPAGLPARIPTNPL